MDTVETFIIRKIKATPKATEPQEYDKAKFMIRRALRAAKRGVFQLKGENKKRATGIGVTIAR